MVLQFARVNDAVTKNTSKVETNKNPFQKAIFQLAPLKSQLNNFLNATEKYKDSEDAEIKQSATLLSAQVLLLRDSTDQDIQFCEKILNNPSFASDQLGTASKELSEIKESQKSAWEGYSLAGNTVSFALIQASNSNDLNSKMVLKIDRNETAKLKAQLVRLFGSSITKAHNASLPIVASPAASLWSFLNQKWEATNYSN